MSAQYVEEDGLHIAWQPWIQRSGKMSNPDGFGGGEKLASLGTVSIPLSIEGKNFHLETEVVTSDIPCLLSKGVMKKAKTIIDTDKDMITFLNKRINMTSTESGHYLMDVQDWKREYDHEEIVESMVLLCDLDNMDTNNGWKAIKRMHDNLGHPGQRTFETMLKNSTFKDLETKLINKLYEMAPMAQDFNHPVCMDLKIWHGTGTIILYIIDMFTRFTIAKVIPDKTADSVLKVHVNDWIKFWGSPSQI